jgi:hypothetical protein
MKCFLIAGEYDMGSCLGRVFFVLFMKTIRYEIIFRSGRKNSEPVAIW